MPVEIVWSPLALARLQENRAYVALVYLTKDKPQAAERLATRIVAVVEAFRTILASGTPEPSRESAS
ncbi:MAG: hypothetical protein ACJ71W_20685 [Terriglobales bacterium]